MSDHIRLEGSVSSGDSSAVGVEAVNGSAVCKIEKKGWLKGILPMAVCCTAPLLLVGAVALFGISLGALASGFLSFAALLACPVGMYLMMRMMMNKK